MNKSIHELNIGEANELMRRGELSSRQLVEACLEQIRLVDPKIHAFLEVYEEDAIKAADRSDERRARGESLGDLDGIPVALKDNILVQGKRATAASKILENHISASDATVTRKLVEAGAVIIGKTNLDEFAMGSSTEHSAFGPTLHPRDSERVAGGSSGGSAAAVAAHMCLAALGSDTGGSIRQPAAFCGITGFKPTYGRVSRSGLMAMASSFDQIGPLAKTVRDAATVFSAIQGQDVLDQTTSDHQPFSPKWTEGIVDKPLSGIRIGLPRQAWGKGISDDVREQVENAIETFKSLGAEVKEVDLPYADEALAVYYVLMPCEVSANLSRFDGMRYGLRKESLPLFETYATSRAEGFGPEARRRILLGTYALSHGYYDAYYLQAKKVQTLIRQGYEKAFAEVDVLLTPTTPDVAFKVGEKVNDPLAMYLEDIFTVGVNVAGLPALSVPCGEAKSLPVGVHLTGSWFNEAKLLAIADAYERQVNKAI